MNVHMAAFGDIGHDAAYVVAILQDGVADFQIAKSDFVAERNSIERLEVDGLIGFHNPAGNFFAGLHVLDNDDANRVGFVMNDEICSYAILLKSMLRNLICTASCRA